MSSALVPAALVLLGAAFFQWQLLGDITYPPVIFCVVWGGVLLWLSLAGARYLPLTNDTIAFFVTGAGMFSLGGAGARALPAIGTDQRRAATESPTWLVPALTISTILAAPLYVRRVIELVGNVAPETFLYALRVRTIDPNATETIGPIANVVVFAMICAMISVALPQRTTIGRVSRVILIGVALALTVLTGSRAGPVTLMLSLTGILAIRRMITYRGVAWITVAGVLLFGAMGLFLRKGAASPDASFSDNLYALVHDLEDYSLGGSVAFNSLDGDRRAIPDNGHYLRTFNEIASHLGARTEVPPLHLQYSPIGDGLSTNVYTMYYSYFSRDGKLGALILTMVCGLVSALVHRSAARGGLIATLLYGSFAAAVAQSPFNEGFFTNLNFLAKLMIASVVLIMLMRGVSLHSVPDTSRVSAA